MLAHVKFLSVVIAMADLLAAGAMAQPVSSGAPLNFPAKPVHLVVPFAPAGAGDLFGRTVAQRYKEAWGQEVVVENRGGARGEMWVRNPPPTPRPTATRCCWAISECWRSIPRFIERCLTIRSRVSIPSVWSAALRSCSWCIL